MTGLVKQVWQICAVGFVVLLPYVVLKRRLWLPGMIAVAYSTLAEIKLTPAKWGPIRVYHVIMLASLLTIGMILMERRWRAHPARQISGLSQAPVFLVGLLFLMGLRTSAEYIYTGNVFLEQELLSLAIGTILPCLVILTHPVRDDALPEVLRGIALGALLALLPALVDFDALSDFWVDFTSGSLLQSVRIGYRDRNTLASWAFYGSMSMFFLSILRRTVKGRWVRYTVAICLAAFVIVTQSRRWGVSLASLLAVMYLFWVRRDGFFERSVRPSSAQALLAGMVVGGLMLYAFYQVFRIESRFERLAVNALLAELGPSAIVAGSYSRGDVLRLALKVWIERPFFGVGVSGFGWHSYAIEEGTGLTISHHIGAHNLAADVLVQHGIVGAGLSISFLVAMFRFLTKWMQSGRDERVRTELRVLILCWTALFPAAIFGGWDPHRLQLLAVLPCVALLVAKSHIARESRRNQIPKAPATDTGGVHSQARIVGQRRIPRLHTYPKDEPKL